MSNFKTVGGGLCVLQCVIERLKFLEVDLSGELSEEAINAMTLLHGALVIREQIKEAELECAQSKDNLRRQNHEPGNV